MIYVLIIALGLRNATPSGHFLNCPSSILQPQFLVHHRNKRMIRGRLFGKHTIFQMVRMMIDGIIGVLRTGEQSGTVQNFALNTWMMNNWNSLLVLRGVHPKELLKSCVRSIQTYHSLVSMMNQEWRLQDTIRTV